MKYKVEIPFRSLELRKWRKSKEKMFFWQGDIYATAHSRKITLHGKLSAEYDMQGEFWIVGFESNKKVVNTKVRADAKWEPKEEEMLGFLPLMVIKCSMLR